MFRIREKSVNQISVFILRGWSARSSDTEYRNTVYLGGVKSSQWIQISVFSYFSAWGYNYNWERRIKIGTDGRWQFYWEEVGKRIYIGNYIIYYIIIIYIIYILYI